MEKSQTTTIRNLSLAISHVFEASKLIEDAGKKVENREFENDLMVYAGRMTKMANDLFGIQTKIVNPVPYTGILKEIYSCEQPQTDITARLKQETLQDIRPRSSNQEETKTKEPNLPAPHFGLPMLPISTNPGTINFSTGFQSHSGMIHFMQQQLERSDSLVSNLDPLLQSSHSSNASHGRMMQELQQLKLEDCSHSRSNLGRYLPPRSVNIEAQDLNPDNQREKKIKINPETQNLPGAQLDFGSLVPGTYSPGTINLQDLQSHSSSVTHFMEKQLEVKERFVANLRPSSSHKRADIEAISLHRQKCNRQKPRRKLLHVDNANTDNSDMDSSDTDDSNMDDSHMNDSDMYDSDMDGLDKDGPDMDGSDMNDTDRDDYDFI